MFALLLGRLGRSGRAPLLLVLLIASLAGPAPIAAGQETTLPVRRVVLYKHGIGYFEREGDVTGDAMVALRFRQDEMSDVLKTLTALDLSGGDGAIATIAYDSQKPPERVLSEFAFNLRADNTQQALLTQLRGAHVTADVAGRGVLRGSVLGIDHQQEIQDGTEISIPRLSLLTDDGAVVSADLFDMHELKFDNADLAAEVARYLAVLRSTHRRDEKSVELMCTGQGERSIFVSYAVEQPVWKATYRIVLMEQGEPLLQGWAVVDNTSDEDWEGVQLSLVAGLPVSFRQDLYTPRYRERPWIDVTEEAAVSPEMMTGFLAFASEKEQLDAEPMEQARKRSKDMDKFVEFRAKAAGAALSANADRRAQFEDSMEAHEAQSVTREIGELLEYEIDHPVTIRRNRSALLPIVAARVKGERVALYNEGMRASNPLAAVRFENTSGVTLEGGPVTVLEADTYAGEAFIDSVKPDDLRYVPFAVDLGVRASTKFDSRSDRVRSVVIARGTMLSTYLEVERKTYTFENRGQDTRTIVVEHAERPGYHLREPERAFEKELGLYRFKIDVDADETGALTVVEAQERSRGYQLANVTSGQIALFLEEGVLNDEAEAMLRDVVAAKGRIQMLRAEAELRRRRLGEIDENQARIRKNLGALGNTEAEKDLRQKYVDELAREEETVKELKSEMKDFEARTTEQQRELDQRLATFALEYNV